VDVSEGVAQGLQFGVVGGGEAEGEVEHVELVLFGEFADYLWEGQSCVFGETRATGATGATGEY
jgi:hypothetical protein